MTSTADTIIKGSILTMDGFRPQAASIAIKDGIIQAVGDDVDSLDDDYAGPGTRTVIVPNGQIVLPGFGDVHVHLLLAGHRETFEYKIDLSWSVEDILQGLRKAVESVPEGRWIVGGFWNLKHLDKLNDVDMLRKIDIITGDIPMLLRDDTAHNRLVNTAALRLMGIDPEHADRYGSDVYHTEDGKATGVLTETASRWAEETLEANNRKFDREIEDSLATAVSIMNERGITMMQECGTGENMLRAFHNLDRERALNSWIVTSVSLNDRIFGFLPIGHDLVIRASQYAGRKILPTYAKIFGDGTPPTYTAYWHEAYSLTKEYGADYHGRPNLSLDDMTNFFELLNKEHMGCVIHCAGDAAVSMVLDARDRIIAQGGNIPVHVAHAQYIRSEDYSRMADDGVFLDISPQFWFPSDYHYSGLGTMPAEITENICLFRDLINNGVTLAGGSDWPCSPDPNPWFGIHGLVTRMNPHGDFPGIAYRPDQSLSLEESIRLYTINVAKAMGIDDRTGSITLGKEADLAICEDPFAVQEQDICRIRTLQTWSSGRVVYER